MNIEEYDDLGSYNGDSEHDMWVDFCYYVIGLPLCSYKENTGTPDVFDEDNIDEYIDNLNDWD